MRLLIIAVLLFPALASAQLVTGVGGVFKTDSTVTITGSSFGTKGNAAPVLWDYVSNQDAYSGLSQGDDIPVYDDGGCSDCPWKSHIPVEWGNPPLYWETGPRVTGRDFYRINQKGFFRGFDYGTNEPDVIFVSWWFRASKAIHPDGGSCKFIRFWAGGAYENGASSWTQMHCTRITDTNHDCTYDVIGDPNWAQWGGDSETDTWHHMESYSDSRGNHACGYGELVHKVNNTTIHDIDFYSADPQNYLYLLGIDPSTPAGLSGETFDMSEIYVDTVLARVAIGDASTWSNVEHYEMQLPTAWSSTSITVDFNQGTFDADDTAYLYVFDRDGDVSNGYEITIEGEGEPPADPPISPVDTLRCADYDP